MRLQRNVTIAPTATLTVHGPTVLNGAVSVPAALFTQHGPFAIDAADQNSTRTRNMTATARSICFVSTVSHSELDAPSEWGSCSIGASAGVWVLSAVLSGTSNANVYCEARCLSW